jgi:hypothetical protein
MACSNDPPRAGFQRQMRSWVAEPTDEHLLPFTLPSVLAKAPRRRLLFTRGRM